VPDITDTPPRGKPETATPGAAEGPRIRETDAPNKDAASLLRDVKAAAPGTAADTSPRETEAVAPDADGTPTGLETDAHAPFLDVASFLRDVKATAPGSIAAPCLRETEADAPYADGAPTGRETDAHAPFLDIVSLLRDVKAAAPATVSAPSLRGTETDATRAAGGSPSLEADAPAAAGTFSSPRTEEDMEVLRIWAAGGSGDKLARRAKSVLYSLDGFSDAAAARKFGSSTCAVATWRKRFLTMGPAGLRRRQGPPRHRVYPYEATRDMVLGILEGPPPKDRGPWTPPAIGRELGITAARVREVFRREELTPPAGRSRRPARPRVRPEADMDVLRAWAACPDSEDAPDPAVAGRARAVLASLEGLAPAPGARPGLTETRRWTRRFLARGPEGILNASPLPPANADDRSRAEELLSAPPPEGLRAWHVPALAEELGISQMRVRNALKEAGIRLAPPPGKTLRAAASRPPEDLEALRRISEGEGCVPPAGPRVGPPGFGPAVRAKAVLKSLEGLEDKEVGDLFGVNWTSVTRWKKLYARGGPEALLDRPQAPPPRVFPYPETRDRVLELLKGPPPPGSGAWTAKALTLATGLSAFRIREVLKKEGITTGPMSGRSLRKKQEPPEAGGAAPRVPPLTQEPGEG
jgi:transposase